MSDIKNIKDLISRWPDKSSIADDCGISLGAVHKWIDRCCVPSKHWNAVIKSAKKFEISNVNLCLLHSLNSMADDTE